MMSVGTGIPGNPPWLECDKFNSTIDFDVLIPDHSSPGLLKVNCQAEFMNGTLPEGITECTPVVPEGASVEGFGTVKFGMTPYRELGERRVDMSYVMHLARTDTNMYGCPLYLYTF